MQQQQRPPRLHHTPRSYTKLATTPPPLHTPPMALAIKRAPCGHTPRGTDGDAAWRRRGFPPKRPRGPLLRRLSIGLVFRSAARCPAETPARIDVATKAHHPHLPAGFSEARKGRGEGQRVLSRLADTDKNAPRRERGAVPRGRVEKRTSEYWREYESRSTRGCLGGSGHERF